MPKFQLGDKIIQNGNILKKNVATVIQVHDYYFVIRYHCRKYHNILSEKDSNSFRVITPEDFKTLKTS